MNARNPQRRCDEPDPATPALAKSAAVLGPEELNRQLRAMLGEGLHHATRVAVQNAVAALLAKASLALTTIAAALAASHGILQKNAARRLEHLLTSPCFDPWKFADEWVRYIVRERTEMIVALDWTEFDADDMTTLCAYSITNHGRATPLLWKTFRHADLKDGNKPEEEDRLLIYLHSIMPSGVHITLLGDRGFADQKLMEILTSLGWSFVIRIRKNITIENRAGEARPAAGWLRPDGRAVRLEGVKITADRTDLGSFVAVHAKAMKDPWLLACSADIFSASMAIQLYGKRFSIEETFRDQQDPRFGLGMDYIRCDQPEKRDRLILLATLAQALLTLLGYAGEVSGADKTLSYKTNKRQFSLYRQGKLYFELLPTMPEPYRSNLVLAFGEVIQQHAFLNDPLGYL